MVLNFEINPENSIELKCAEKILEITPRVMNLIRTQMRDVAENSGVGMTIPQFRILNRLSKQSTNYSDLAAWIGVSLPGISRMMEGLVHRGWVERDRSHVDRRQVGLRLSAQGRKFVEETRALAQQRFATRFQGQSAKDRSEMLAALETLDRVLFRQGSETQKPASTDFTEFPDNPREAIENTL